MLDRLVCLLRRQHDYALREGGGRVYLLCRRCGVRTPGWETSPRIRAIPTGPPPLQILLDKADAGPDGVLPLDETDEQTRTYSDLRIVFDDLTPDAVVLPLGDHLEHPSGPSPSPLRLTLADTAPPVDSPLHVGDRIRPVAETPDSEGSVGASQEFRIFLAAGS